MAGPCATLGPRIDGHAIALGVSRKAIAAKSGIHTSTLSKIANGHQDLNAWQAYIIGVAVGQATRA